MSDKENKLQLRAAALSLALLAGAGIPLGASAQAIGSAPADAMTVVKDADGKVRAATGEEMQAMKQQLLAKAQMMVRAAPQATQQKFHGSGARGARLTDDFMSSAVAVRSANGGVEMQCLEPGHSAQAPHPAHTTLQPVTE